MLGAGLPGMPRKSILIVEDNEDDVVLLRRAFSSAKINHPVHVVEDGCKATDYLEGKGQFADREKFPFPSLVLLDMKLPRKSGQEVLQCIRATAEWSDVAVTVLVASGHDHDIENALAIGASGYLVKPPKAADLVDLAQSEKLHWLQFGKGNSAAEAGPSDGRANGLR